MAFLQNSLFVEADERMRGDDDDISLTSTVEEGGDYDVEELLFEREDPDAPGEPQFLIKWEGYPLDQCTWEPRQHLGEGVYEVWEATKAEIQAGKRPPFDMQIYYDALEKASMAKSERHAKRNAKRRRLGFPLTEPLPIESPATASVASIEDSDHGGEAVESNEIDPGQLPKPSPKPAVAQVPSQRAIKQKTFQGIPSPKPQNEVLAEPKQLSYTSVPKFSGTTAAKPSQAISKPRAGTSSTITGYKGTARPSASRKSSMNSNAGSPTSPTNRQRIPPVRTSSGSAPSSSTAAPPRSSSLRDKFSGKKATRTRTERHAIPNVFSSGKVVQKRRNLMESMIDPAKDPKQFTNMRLRGIARKKGNELNDAAPLNVSAIPAAFILTGDQTRSKGQKENQAEHGVRSPSGQSTPLAPVSSTGSPGVSDGAAPAKKPKKSVRFEADDASEIPTAPDDFDPVLSERLGSPPAGTDSSVANTNAKKKLTLAKYQGRPSAQTIARPCSFGHSGSRVIQAKFSNIPHQNQEWLSIFQAEEVLDFHLMCSSDDFMSQRLFLCQEILSSGSIEADSEESAPYLENVAEHMRRRSSGLYTAKPGYSILVYPFKCDSWTGVAGDHTQETTTQSSLGYLIFKPPITIKQYPNHAENLDEAIGEENKPIMERLAKVMMDLDFSALTAPGPKTQDNPVFMLIFPLEDIQLLRVIMLWLRNCEPQCRIFSSDIKGSFAKFIECTKRAPATVILHEEVTTRIRRIPLIFQMLERGYNFYSLATGRRTPPRFPSLLDFDLKPNQHAVTRLFPHGRAFLITPSFVISDPIKFYEFVDWFGSWCQNPRYLIVASADFPQWFQGLCLEKGRELMRHKQTTKSGASLDRLLYTNGLSKDRTDALVKAWRLLGKIMNDYGDEETHMGVQRVMWAPREINSNDEQSLVNWFFWWSTMFLDQHRRFYVLGSNAKYQGQAYRTVRVPNYDPEQTLDPEKLRERNRLKGEAEEHEVLAYWDAQSIGPTLDGTSQADSRQNAHVATNTRPLLDQRPILSQTELGFPTKLFKSDRAVELGDWLKQLDRETKSLWATPFHQPVSWEDVRMADHFGDPFCEYANFNHWLSSCSEFSNRANTWAGLFYTPDGDWDHTRPASTYTRRPWLAVLRPVNPHRKLSGGYGPMELFLWDAAVNKPADLSDIQIRLVDFVQREATRLVSSNYYLEKLWYGNKPGNSVSPQDHPLDMACLHLRDMILDTRHWLPPFEQLLPTRGWNQLPLPYVAQRKSGGVEKEPAVPQAKNHHQQPFPKHPSDEGEPPAIVWLPPRGTSQQFGCYNDLYEAAYRSRIRDAACREFKFTYRPTTEWYDQQKREGRGCSHVWVDAGDKILDGLPKIKGDRKSK